MKGAHNPYRLKMDDFPGRLFDHDKRELALTKVAEFTKMNKAIVVEIGSGSGGHLIERARQEPQTAFFGIELRFKRAYRTIEKSVEQSIDNTYVLRFHADQIEDFFPQQSLSGIYVLFPDPWEKKRDRKKRTLQARFLDKVVKLVKPGGFLRVKTDHREYFESFFVEFENDARFSVEQVSKDLQKSGLVSDNVESEFEQMFRTQQKPVCYLNARVLG